MTDFNIVYYTFLDSSMDFYTKVNTNFIELTHKYNYIVLISGFDNGIPYQDKLSKILGKNTIYIESKKNAFTTKFNLFKKYIIKNKEKYKDSIFCKIDTDLVHYKCEEFHSLLKSKFNDNINYFIGNKKQYWIRGGLNAIHFKSIESCPDLPEENYSTNDLDMIFSKILKENNIVKFEYINLFDQSHKINLNLYATHTVNSRLNPDKLKEVLSLVKQIDQFKIDN